MMLNFLNKLSHSSFPRFVLCFFILLLNTMIQNFSYHSLPNFRQSHWYENNERAPIKSDITIFDGLPLVDYTPIYIIFTLFLRKKFLQKWKVCDKLQNNCLLYRVLIRFSSEFFLNKLLQTNNKSSFYWQILSHMLL